MSTVVSYDDALAQLLAMFGETYDLDTIKLVLKHNRGHLENTVNDLLEGRIPRPRPSAQVRSRQYRQTQPQQERSISYQRQPQQPQQQQQVHRKPMESMSNTPQQPKEEELSTWDKLAAFFRPTASARPPSPSSAEDDEDGYELVPTSKAETLTQRKTKKKDDDFDAEEDGSYYGGAIL